MIDVQRAQQVRQLSDTLHSEPTQSLLTHQPPRSLAAAVKQRWQWPTLYRRA